MSEIIEVPCPACDGDGFNIVADCCGNYKSYGCCGIPKPVRDPCPYCQATGNVTIEAAPTKPSC